MRNNVCSSAHMRHQSQENKAPYLDPLLEIPAVPPVVLWLLFDWSHWRNCIQFNEVIVSFSLIHSGSFVEGDGDVRCRYVAFIPIVPTNTSPSISFVLLYYSQYLPLLHRDGPFTGTCKKREGGGKILLQKNM